MEFKRKIFFGKKFLGGSKIKKILTPETLKNHFFYPKQKKIYQKLLSVLLDPEKN